MGTLIYSGLTSLDGYVVDSEGSFDWAMPDEEVHAAVNDLQRQVSLFIFGRRMYEVLLAWETMDVEGEPAEIADYQRLWLATDKVVVSTSLTDAQSTRTRILDSFDADAIAALVTESPGLVSIGGPTVAAHAIRAGLVDEFHQYVSPVIVGGGTRYLPTDARIDLRLADSRTFSNGVVYSKYVRK
jgi:dihydrofolate reductase